MFAQIKQKLKDKKFRLLQFEQAIFRDLIENIDQLSVFPLELRKSLKKEELFLLKAKDLRISTDKKTFKIIFETKDKHKIESVLIRHYKRNTVCVSSQIGCICGCKFCATGKLGFLRNLNAQEIIEQVLFFNRFLRKEYFTKNKENLIELKKWNNKNPFPSFRVRNIVFMGMGEPLLNLENVLQAIEVFNDHKKFNIGQRKITISTVGIIPQIKVLQTKKMQVNLAVSLHACTQKKRSEIIPISKKYPLEQLLKSLWSFSAVTKRRIFLVFTIIKDFNDNQETARILGKICKNKLVHINFIPLNENKENSSFKKPLIEKIRLMQKILLNEFAVVSTIRETYGSEIDSACGQLAGKI